MLETLTFDAEPLVAFFLGEPKAVHVISLLQGIHKQDIKGYINIVNLTEVYSALARHDAKLAEQKIDVLKLYGLEVVSAEHKELWRKAALLKNKHLLSLGDAYAVATAQATKSKLVIGADKELNRLNIPLVKLK